MAGPFKDFGGAHQKSAGARSEIENVVAFSDQACPFLDGFQLEIAARHIEAFLNVDFVVDGNVFGRFCTDNAVEFHFSFLDRAFGAAAGFQEAGFHKITVESHGRKRGCYL